MAFHSVFSISDLKNQINNESLRKWTCHIVKNNSWKYFTVEWTNSENVWHSVISIVHDILIGPYGYENRS